MRCVKSSNPVLALRLATAALVVVCVAATMARAQQQPSSTIPPQLPSDASPGPAPPASRYSSGEIIDAGHHFFGGISKGVALIVEKAADQWGQPDGYILGEEAGGAFIGGLRYGDGMLYTKNALSDATLLVLGQSYAHVLVLRTSASLAPDLQRTR